LVWQPYNFYEYNRGWSQIFDKAPKRNLAAWACSADGYNISAVRVWIVGSSFQLEWNGKPPMIEKLPKMSCNRNPIPEPNEGVRPEQPELEPVPLPGWWSTKAHMMKTSPHSTSAKIFEVKPAI